MQEIDKIKYSDLFEGNPFAEAQKNIQGFLDSIKNFQEANKKLAKELQETLKIASSTNVEELEKIERLLKISSQLAKQNEKAEKERQKIVKAEVESVKKAKEAVELTFEQLVALEKQKIEKTEILKKAKEQAKTELELLKSAETQKGAYKELNDRLNTLRKTYKDIAAEARKLELAGDNPEKVQKLKLELQKLLPEIEELDQSLKDIDGSVGQFQRNVGDYKNKIVSAFDEVKGKIDNNVKNLLGVDERFEAIGGTVDTAKKSFSDFNQEIKNAPTFVDKISAAFKNFGSLMINLVKAGGIGLLLIALTNLQAVAQKVGGVFNNVKDNVAGLGAVLEAITTGFVSLGKSIGSLITLNFDDFKKNLSDAFDANLSKVNTLAKEISRLTRQIEILTKDASNNYGNFASDIETYSQIVGNAFKSDEERAAAALKVFEIQRQDLELRLGLLLAQQRIQEKQLDLETEITKAEKEKIKLIRSGTLEAEARKKLILELPPAVQTALLTLEGTIGDIEVLNEEIQRKGVELTTFLLERSLKDTELVVKANLNVLKKAIDTEFKEISPNLPFVEAISQIETLAKKLETKVGSLLDEIFKEANIDLKEFNGLNALAIKDSDELNQKLKNLGVGEAYRTVIIDVWKDGQNELLKYVDALDATKLAFTKSTEEAEKQILSFRKVFEEIVASQELAEAQLNLSIGNGIAAYERFRKAQENVFDLRIKNLKEENNELLRTARSEKERQAIFEKTVNEIEKIENERSLFRAKSEAENIKRINNLQKEINEIIRQRQELEINTEITNARKNIIFTLEKTKKLQNDILSIQVERLIIERNEALKFAQTEEEKNKILESFEQKRLKLAEENALKLREINKQYVSEVITFFQNVANQAQNTISNNFAKQIRNIEGQITQLNTAIERERELASQGIQTNIDALEKQAAEFEIKKRELAKREQNAQLALAFINSVATYAKEDPKTAVPKAFKDILLTKLLANVISGAFAEGVEAFEGKGTETSDSNLVLISKGESIITAKATKKYAGLATAMNEDKVGKWIQNNYGTNINIEVDELGNFVTKQVSEAGKRIVKSITQRPRL